MNREQLEFSISQYLDGTLPGEQRSLLEQRLEGDAEARELLAPVAGRIGGSGHGQRDLFREFCDFFGGKQTCFHIWQLPSKRAAVGIEDEHARLPGHESRFTCGFHVRPPGWPV